MSQDIVTARDIMRSLPTVLKKFPFVAKGLYYYRVKDDKKELTLGKLVERNADKHPTRPAILFDDRSITWAELDAWSNRIAHYLKDHGLVKGDAIAVEDCQLGPPFEASDLEKGVGIISSGGSDGAYSPSSSPDDE